MSYMKNLIAEVVGFHNLGMSVTEICMELEINYTEVESILAQYGDLDVFEMV